MKTKICDFLVIGGGISGVSTASELTSYGSVVLLERESTLAYHTTGRSAATLMESYGNELIRKLTCSSRDTFQYPPEDRDSQPLSTNLGALIVGDDARESLLRSRFQVVKRQVPSAILLDARQIREVAPLLAAGRWIGGIYEPNALHLDVPAIHKSYTRALLRKGGTIRENAEVVSASHAGAAWTVRLRNGDALQAGIIVNAAGAWADETAAACGSRPIGLQALRRTVAIVECDQDMAFKPYVGTIDEQIFFKPDARGLLVSPADETPDHPRDAVPEEADIALLMQRLESATTLRRPAILHRWAGLRVFVPDRSPVIGYDPQAEGFFWCAALGGYGIQIAPTMGRLCARMITRSALSHDLADIPLDEIAPERFSRGTHAMSALAAVAELK